MLRAVATALVLYAVSPAGERLESTYPEGSVLVYALEGTFAMRIDEMRMTLDDVEVSPEDLEGVSTPSFDQTTRYRCRNEVLESADGRPTRMRRLYEQLHELSVDDGEESEKTGPLEGLALLLSEADGEPLAELQDDGEEVDAKFLEHHRMARDQDFFLPPGEVEIGDEWALDEQGLRLFMGLDASPLLFEPDEGEEEDSFDKLVDEASQVSGKARLVEMEERDGLDCAVIGFTIELEAEVDDLGALGFELEEGMPEPTGSVELRMTCEGKLWHALAERRPVAMEQDLGGSMTISMVMRLPVENAELAMKMDMQGTIDGEATTLWTLPE